jgi:hypothetical protein
MLLSLELVFWISVSSIMWVKNRFDPTNLRSKVIPHSFKENMNTTQKTKETYITPYYILQILYGAKRSKKNSNLHNTHFILLQFSIKNRCNTHFHTNIADECRTYLTLQRGEQLHQYIKYTLIIISSYLSLLLLHM